MKANNQVHIIIAEDEAITAMFLEMELEKSGYAVTTVSTGEHAVTVFNEMGADVAIMDVNLASGISGIEAVRKMQGCGTLPVIFMTGYRQESFAGEMEGVDYSAFLGKPVNISELKQAVAEALK